VGKLTTYVQWVSRQMQSAQHWVTKTLTDIVGLVAIPWSALRQVFRRDTRNKAGTELRALQGMSWQAETVLVDARKRDLESLTQVELPAEARRTPLAQLPRPMLKDGVVAAFFDAENTGREIDGHVSAHSLRGPNVWQDR